MSVDLVNGHVLLPHLPDWGQRITHRRTWQNEVGRGLNGGEHRVAMRHRPRLSLSWGLVPHDSEEQALMHARLRAAVKSGYGCVPHWGRGIQVSGTSGADLTLTDSPWAFVEAGDYVLVRGLDVTDPETWETAEVDSIAGSVITMTGSLATAWGTDAWCWPLLFGAFTCGQLNHRSDWHTPVQCSLRTLETAGMTPFEDICFPVDATGATGSCDNLNAYAPGSSPTDIANSLWMFYGDPADSTCWDGNMHIVNLPPIGGMDDVESTGTATYNDDRNVSASESSWGKDDSAFADEYFSINQI